MIDPRALNRRVLMLQLMARTQAHAPESVAGAPMMAPEVTGLDKALRDDQASRLMDRAEIAALGRRRP